MATLQIGDNPVIFVSVNSNRNKSIKSSVRRAGALLLLSVYLLLSVGIIKATHFCMGREASVVFFSAEAKKCACSSYALEKDTCCDEKQELLRIDDEQKLFSNFTVPAPNWKLERVIAEQFVKSELTKADATNKDEVLIEPVPLWKSHCSLVLYDDEHAA